MLITKARNYIPSESGKPKRGKGNERGICISNFVGQCENRAKLGIGAEPESRERKNEANSTKGWEDKSKSARVCYVLNVYF